MKKKIGIILIAIVVLGIGGVLLFLPNKDAKRTGIICTTQENKDWGIEKKVITIDAEKEKVSKIQMEIIEQYNEKETFDLEKSKKGLIEGIHIDEKAKEISMEYDIELLENETLTDYQKRFENSYT